MLQTLTLYVYAIFGLTVIATIGWFFRAANYSRSFLILISLWIVFQSVLGGNGFYKISNATPPRFIFLVLPPVLFVLICLIIPNGRRFIDHLNIKTLTLLHLIRIPVEIVLYWLFLEKAVPGAMTFEGRNFDILSGLTAPLIWYFGFVKGSLNKRGILIWNLICLGLLLNVVSIAMLTVVTKGEAFGFDASKLALVDFPFLLLPSCLVPLVLFSHVAAIRQLLKKKTVQ